MTNYIKSEFRKIVRFDIDVGVTPFNHSFEKIVGVGGFDHGRIPIYLEIDSDHPFEHEEELVESHFLVVKTGQKYRRLPSDQCVGMIESTGGVYHVIFNPYHEAKER